MSRQPDTAAPAVPAKRVRNGAELATLVLLVAGMVAPLWLGSHPLANDFTTHLLEADIVAHYHDPRYGYDVGYYLQPWWWVGTNALATVVIAAFARILSIEAAGRLWLHGYMLLMAGGVRRLLRQRDTSLVLLPLAAPLAYAVPFTLGWANFSMATALSLHLLALARRWLQRGDRRSLVAVAMLAVLIHGAHLLGWALGAVLVAIEAGSVDWRTLRRRWPLAVALLAPLPLVAAVRPAMAAAAALGVVAAACGASFVRTARPHVIAMGVAAVAVGALLVAGPFRSFGQRLVPGADLVIEFKLRFLLQTFTLPHLFLPPDPWLSLVNVLLIGLGAALTVLIALGFARDPAAASALIPAAAFALLYAVTPGGTADIQIVEPRVMVFAAIAAITAISPSVLAPHTRAIRAIAVLLAATTLVGAMHLGRLYASRTDGWAARLSALRPARQVLVLSGDAGPRAADAAVGFRTSGEEFATSYNVGVGGFNSRTYYNGAVRHRPTMPIPAYWPYDTRDSSARFVRSRCADLREAYDAVIVWGGPQPDLRVALESCFGPLRIEPDLALWRKPSS